MIQYNLGGAITYSRPTNLGRTCEEIITHAAAAYGFLLNTSERRGRAFTWPQFAGVIEQHFADSPRLQAITRTLRGVA